MTVGYQLKHRHGFFAAGIEFSRALSVLGDAAFKIFAHVCLEAESGGRSAAAAPPGGWPSTAPTWRGGWARAVAPWGATCANWSAPGCATGSRPLPTSTAARCSSCGPIVLALPGEAGRVPDPRPLQRPRPTSSKSGGRSAAALACRRTSARPTSVLPPPGSHRAYLCKRSSTPRRVRDPRGGGTRDLPFRGRFLQPETPPFRARLSLAGGIRAGLAHPAGGGLTQSQPRARRQSRRAVALAVCLDPVWEGSGQVMVTVRRSDPTIASDRAWPSCSAACASRWR